MFGNSRHGQRPAPPQSSEPQRETILLVEDEPAVRQLLPQALMRAGYKVHEARNGQEAIKVFDQHGDSVDLLLTDMRMPFMGGAELARQLRTRRPTLKLLCISGLCRRRRAGVLGRLSRQAVLARRAARQGARDPRPSMITGHG